MKNIFLFSFLILFGTNCGTRCKGADENLGAIKRSLDKFGYRHAEKVRINDDSTLSQYFKDTIKLDFTLESILGQSTDGGCDIRNVREVLRDSQSKTVNYKIIRYQCGTCKTLELSNNWVVVDKIPADWNVEFQVDYK